MAHVFVGEEYMGCTLVAVPDLAIVLSDTDVTRHFSENCSDKAWKKYEKVWNQAALHDCSVSSV